MTVQCMAYVAIFLRMSVGSGLNVCGERQSGSDPEAWTKDPDVRSGMIDPVGSAQYRY